MWTQATWLRNPPCHPHALCLPMSVSQRNLLVSVCFPSFKFPFCSFLSLGKFLIHLLLSVSLLLQRLQLPLPFLFQNTFQYFSPLCGEENDPIKGETWVNDIIVCLKAPLMPVHNLPWEAEKEFNRLHSVTQQKEKFQPSGCRGHIPMVTIQTWRANLQHCPQCNARSSLEFSPSFNKTG